MKKLIAFFLVAIFALNYTNAQSNEPTFEDYNRYIDAKLEMNYRNSSIENLGLTSEEIVEFDPIFRNYMNAKSSLFNSKMELLEDFEEEMAEDDSEKNQNEDRADYIEDYWEVEIAESELRKDYYDKLENKISKDKAAKFFLYEEAIENRIYNNVVSATIPQFVDIDKMPSTDEFIYSNTTGETVAKTADVSDSDYNRYIDNKLEVEFRNVTLDVLDFSKEEIIAFDPVYRDYMRAKDKVFARKLALYEKYNKEMMSDNSMADKAEDQADFIDEYWEARIAGMELSKDYFDILEDKIPVKKAAKFFLWEKAVENRVSSNILLALMPHLISIERVPMKEMDKVTMEKEAVMPRPVSPPKPMLSSSTTKMIAEFNTWVKNNRGKVDLSHEYTSNGLTTLVKTIEAVKNDMKVDIPNFESKKSMILDNAHEITVDWKETDHANHTKDSFQAVAELMSGLNGNTKGKLKNIANQLNDDRLMTKQAETIYDFFDAANNQLQKINDSTAFNKTSNKANSSSRK